MHVADVVLLLAAVAAAFWSQLIRSALLHFIESCGVCFALHAVLIKQLRVSPPGWILVP